MAVFPIRLVPPNTKVPFIAVRKIALAGSAVAMLASIALFFLMGLNFGIDFRGGTLIEVRFPQAVDLGEVRSVVSDLGLGDVKIQEFGSPEKITVRLERQPETEELSSEEAQQLAADDVKEALASHYAGTSYEVNLEADEVVNLAVREGEASDTAKVEAAVQDLLNSRPNYFANAELNVAALPDGSGSRVSLDFNIDEEVAPRDRAIALTQLAIDTSLSGITYDRTEFIGPAVSDELTRAGTLALVLAVMMMLIYIWFRFEWQFSLGAVLALIHDVILTIGVFAVLQLEFDLSIIAAILTIIGYSMNDTVVVYDRVRENLRKYKKMPLADLLNQTINETLSRTVMTSVTTLLALVALYVFGGQVIKGFTFAMIWGVVVGTYSSIFIASPLLLMTGVKRDWSGEGAPQQAGAMP